MRAGTTAAPRRRLVVVGGGEPRTGANTGILERFVEMCGGPQARVAVISTASSEAERRGTEYTEIFSALGVGDVRAVRLDRRTQANGDEAAKTLAPATGVFFTGGDQMRIAAVLGGTRVDSLLHARVKDGLVLAGTSAGAAMLSSTMILGGNDAGVNAASVRTGPGMEFLPRVLIDPHFAERGRLNRLLSAVAHFPHELGLGIDEETAVVVEGDRWEVMGDGSATVVDAGPADLIRIRTGADGRITLIGAHLHVLPAGYAFELVNRRPLIIHAAEGADGPEAPS